MQAPQFLLTAIAAATLSLSLPSWAQSESPSEAANGGLDISGQRSRTLQTVQVEAAPMDIAVTGPVPLDQTSRTGSLLGMSVRQTPASVTVVDRALMQAIGAEDTHSALRAVPGVTAHDAPGNPTVYYRGFSSGSLAQLYNGIHLQYAAAARPVDSWIYERVETIGGPSSFLYGAGAVGGTINYITKLAQPGNSGEARMRVGSDRLREFSLGINRGLSAGAADHTGPNHSVRLDVNDRRNHGWTEGTRRQATELAASVLTELGSGLKHTLVYEYQREKVDRPYWGTPLLKPVQGTTRIDEATRRKNYNSQDGFYGQRVQWLRSLAEYQVSPRLRLNNTFYAYDAQRDYRNVENYQFNSDNTAVMRSTALLQRHAQSLVGNRIDAVYQGELAGLSSDWAMGLDYSANKQTRFPRSLSGTVSTVDPYDFATEYFWDIEGMAPIFSPDRTVRLKTTAVYAENRTQLSPQVQLLTGLRHERIRMSLTNHQAITANSPAYYKRDYTTTTGRMGLMWEVAPGWNTYVQYATAADPPAGSLTTATFANAINNSDLTTGRQVEWGLKNELWEGKATSTLAVFHITRKNIATQDPNNSSTTLLVGQQSSKGVEWTLGVQPTTRWSLLGNVAYVRAQYDDYVQSGVSLAGKTPTGTPQWVGNLWAQFQLTPALSLGAGLRSVDSSYADANNSVRRPGYRLLDLSANWRLRPHMQLSARVRNATDKVYLLNSNTTSGYLGASRALDVALHVQF